MKCLAIIATLSLALVTAANAQVAPPGTATNLPPIDFTTVFVDAKGHPRYPCDETNMQLSEKVRKLCAVPMTKADAIADALDTPETDAQGKPLPVDAKHARNLELAHRILIAEGPLDLKQEERDRAREAVFYGYRGAMLFDACLIVASAIECAVAPAK